MSCAPFMSWQKGSGLRIVLRVIPWPDSKSSSLRWVGTELGVNSPLSWAHRWVQRGAGSLQRWETPEKKVNYCVTDSSNRPNPVLRMLGARMLAQPPSYHPSPGTMHGFLLKLLSCPWEAHSQGLEKLFGRPLDISASTKVSDSFPAKNDNAFFFWGGGWK